MLINAILKFFTNKFYVTEKNNKIVINNSSKHSNHVILIKL